MPINFVDGDLFTSDADIIGHGVNCVGRMNAGIATGFRDRFSKMHTKYVQLCDSVPADRLIGHASLHVNTGFPYDGPRIIANLFTQLQPGPCAEYKHVMRSINETTIFMLQNNLHSLALPRIGCGLGGLDWSTMQNHLCAFDDLPLNITIYSKD